MSNKVASSAAGAYVIRESQLTRLEGRLLTLMEAFGVNNESAKSIVSQEIWDIVEDYVWIEDSEINNLYSVRNPVPSKS